MPMSPPVPAARCSVIVALLAALLGCAPATLPPRAWDTPSLLVFAGLGPHQIEVVDDLVLEHTLLDKPLNVRVSFPREAARYPIIVFSHGAYSSKDLYTPILDHWATHGYVVLAATHIDSTALGVARGDPNAGRLWPTRVADLSFLLDSMAEIERKVPKLAGKPDLSQVAAAGHSLGGLTAMAMAGASTLDLATQQRQYFHDSRVKAGVFISPPGSLPIIDAQGFSEVRVPAFYTTATDDIIMVPGTTWEWHKDGFRYAPRGDKYLLVLNGADHYLGGIVGRDDLARNPMALEYLNLTNGLTTAFLASYLKGQSGGLAVLTTAGFVSPTVGELTRK